jgi:hypothetical protein
MSPLEIIPYGCMVVWFNITGQGLTISTQNIYEECPFTLQQFETVFVANAKSFAIK